MGTCLIKKQLKNITGKKNRGAKFFFFKKRKKNIKDIEPIIIEWWSTWGVPAAGYIINEDKIAKNKLVFFESLVKRA